MIDEILDQATHFYLDSDRFNGLPIRNLELPKTSIIKNLEKLIQDDLVSIVYGDYHPNPHIRALEDETKESQLSKLQTEKFEQGCIYPLKKHLIAVIDQNNYQGKPYTVELALGEPQLAFRFFDLSILEIYRNDPRYYYHCDDINGQICISDEYYDSPEMHERDQILLNTFGFGYNKGLKNRVTTSLLWYLNCLSPDHQTIWKAKELIGEYNPHVDYYRNSILGEYGIKIMVFDAFLMEMKTINECCGAIGWPNLFKNDFAESKPKEFGFLLRPTEKEYLSFIHLLDKMLSENMNKKFFKDMEPKDKNGHYKGSLTLLAEWIDINFKPNSDHDEEFLSEALEYLKSIRKQRTIPSHSIVEDKFDQDLFKKQRDLIKNAYLAVRVIRTMLKEHPSAADVEVNETIDEGRIWLY